METVKARLSDKCDVANARKLNHSSEEVIWTTIPELTENEGIISVENIRCFSVDLLGDAENVEVRSA